MFQSKLKDKLRSCGSEYSVYSPIITELCEFISGIFPYDCDLQNFLKSCTEMLTNDTEPKLYIMYGTGSNGKSTLVRLLEMAFKKIGRASPSVLSSEHINDVLNPELVCMHHDKVVVIEDTKNIKLNNLLKLLGNKEITVHGYYLPNVTFKPTWKIINMCNDVTTYNEILSNANKADKQMLTDRISVINFNNVFTGQFDNDKLELG